MVQRELGSSCFGLHLWVFLLSALASCLSDSSAETGTSWGHCGPITVQIDDKAHDNLNMYFSNNSTQ